MSDEARPYSRKALEEGGARPEAAFLFFYGHGESAGANAVLSNWYLLPEPFLDADGHAFPTSEHYMMHAKAELFGDKKMAKGILAADTAGKAKALGRKVRNFDQRIWAEKSLSLVADGCELKFAQWEFALEVLLGTKDKILVEAAPRDRIWGIGMGEKNQDRLDPRKWKGKNLLGEALMVARDRLRDEDRRKKAADPSKGRGGGYM